MLELHFLVMRRLGEPRELPFQVIFSRTQSQPAWPGGVQIIKMVTVMRLITLIVFTTHTNFPLEYQPPTSSNNCLPGTSGVGRVAYFNIS